MYRFAYTLFFAALLYGQKAQNVLVVVNQASPLSKSIGEYYVMKRHIPLANVCRVNADTAEVINRYEYEKKIAAPIASCLRSRRLVEQILYIVTTAGLPLRLNGVTSKEEIASLDSELALLYSDMRGRPHVLEGGIPNPFYGKMDATFRHPDFPIYLVTRLAGYDFADVKGIIDRALLAQNRGKFVIDLKGVDQTDGNNWLREAARELPKDRVVLDETGTVLYNQTDVIAYASWGSNDPARHQRHLGFKWLPGAIMTEYVSTNARTFERPPDNWNLGTWDNQATYFKGAPQTLTADYIHDGVSGASGHVDEPYLHLTPHPNFVLPAYFRGRNLAESFYLGIPMLSWQNIVVGDPLMSLGKEPSQLK